MRTALLFALSGASLMAPAAPIDPGIHAMTYTSLWDGTEQPYNLHVPSAHESGEPCPLVVVLHGKGANWQSWFAATSVCEWAEGEGYLLGHEVAEL